MTTTITDVDTYGDAKGRDNYMRNSFFSVKGDGSNANELTQGFYGIPTATDTEYEMARLSVIEDAVDSGVGTITFAARDVTTSLDNVMTLSTLASEIISTTVSLTTTDLIISGNVNASIFIQNNETLGSSIELVDDATDPVINFTVGDITNSLAPIPLVLTQTSVDIPTGVTLTVGGTDILATIDGGNIWEVDVTGFIGQLKTAYTSLEVNVVNAYTPNLALDVNGSMRVRGSNIFFYDSVPATPVHYSVLAFVETSNEVRLRSSRAGDNLVLATTNGSDSTYLDRLTFEDGLGDQLATFTNVNLGIGAANTATGNILEVTGSASLTAGLTVGGDIDLVTNSILNASYVESNTADGGLIEHARIELTSDALDAHVDIVLGPSGSGTTVMTVAETAVTIVPVTTFSDNVIITGDLTISGTTTTVNTSELVVEDINIELASAAASSGAIDGAGITIGNLATLGITPPSITYSDTNSEWTMSLGLQIDAAAAFTVGTTIVDTTGISMTAATPYITFGAAAEWRLGIYNDGVDDHFVIEHEDGAGYVTKLDILQ